ncbi:MAG: hypothetical protein RLO50_00570 [Azospirillaceae bacterium]
MRLITDDDEKLREFLALGAVWAAEERSETPFLFLSRIAGPLREGAAEALADLHARACVRVMTRPDGPERRGALYDCHGSFLSSCRNASDWPGVARCLSAIRALRPAPLRVMERLAPELASVPAGTVPSELLAAFDPSDGKRPS